MTRTRVAESDIRPHGREMSGEKAAGMYQDAVSIIYWLLKGQYERMTEKYKDDPDMLRGFDDCIPINRFNGIVPEEMILKAQQGEKGDMWGDKLLSRHLTALKDLVQSERAKEVTTQEATT